MGFQTKGAKKSTYKHRSIQRRKRDFQKKVIQIVVDKQQQQQQETEFNSISLDESFFLYDSLVRMVCWIDENKRSIVRVAGSHQHSCISGAVSMEGKQIFRQYDRSLA